ncbi:MAG: class II aldolase/adducin family protein [Gemmatimonadetes bacterium]|nr:class II aldolase/adducin family protein [Gemmatimonadota bacterium]
MAVCAVCRRLYDRGLIAGQDGNVSVRLGDDALLVTPAGLSKVDVRPEDLVELGLDGTVRGGARRPSSEVGIHLRAYHRRPDVQAVVHAHPPTATAFAVAGLSLDGASLAELRLGVGPVPLVPYATPGTSGVADAFDSYWASHDAFLMAHHGALAVGRSLTDAHQRMESLEHGARIMWAARALGDVPSLPADALAVLDAQRRAARGA